MGEILDVYYLIEQRHDPRGDWHEGAFRFDTESGARRNASKIHPPTKTRIVKVTREVLTDEPAAERAAPQVRVGQIWADSDKRAAGRTLRVDEIRPNPIGHIALCTILTNATEVQQQLDDPNSGYRGQDARGKQTRIAVRRFTPTSTGYRLIQDAPAT